MCGRCFPVLFTFRRTPTLASRAIFHNEKLYGPDTLAFNPDRFIKREGKELPPDPEPIAFGFGRRICPGRHLAVNTIWLVIAHLLHSFEMVKEVDSDGKEIEPVIQYSEGLTRFVEFFTQRWSWHG